MMFIFFAISANYAIDDIDGGTHEVISNLNRSFGSWYFLNILNERTSFASCLHAFESSSWSIVCIYLLAIELPMLCSASLEIILKLFKFLRMVDLTIWLRCWNVRVNGIPSVFSFCDIYLNARNRIATFFLKLTHCVWYVEKTRCDISVFQLNIENKKQIFKSINWINLLETGPEPVSCTDWHLLSSFSLPRLVFLLFQGKTADDNPLQIMTDHNLTLNDLFFLPILFIGFLILGVCFAFCCYLLR